MNENSKQHIVLLHGITKTAKNMKNIEQFFSALGYTVHNFTYPSMKFSIEDIVLDTIEPKIKEISKEAETLHFVTHSMGGIVLRQYLQTCKLSNIGKIVMLAPPNQGSEVTDFFKNLRIYKWIYGPAGQQLGTAKSDKAICVKLKDTGHNIGIIAGNWSFEFWFHWLFNKQEHDGKVSISSTKLKNMADHITVKLSHRNIVKSQYVCKLILRFLKNGNFKDDK